MAKIWKTCLDLDFTLTNIQNHGWLDSEAIQWVEKVFPEEYRDCLDMDTEEMAHGSDTETDSESDDDNIWIWMLRFDSIFVIILFFYFAI